VLSIRLRKNNLGQACGEAFDNNGIPKFSYAAQDSTSSMPTLDCKALHSSSFREPKRSEGDEHDHYINNPDWQGISISEPCS
jgi:hypothetical protein